MPHRRMLRRETAVELPITSSKLGNTASVDASVDNTLKNINERTSPVFNRNASAEARPYGRASVTSQNYLVPSMSDPNQPRFKKSIESLQKNSSSDTEYSMQPYRVIKQSSNETNTSLTGSFNIDQSFGGHDTSIDTNETSAQNVTVIENTAATVPDQQQQPAAKSSGAKPKVLRELSTEAGSRSLKKQFSIDHSSKAFESNTNLYQKLDSFEGATSSGNGSPKSNLKLPTINTIPATPTRLLAGVSSSTSTDESKDERNIPIISTNVVQDEIAKLSSNINSSNTTDENNTDLPFNETMC